MPDRSTFRAPGSGPWAITFINMPEDLRDRPRLAALGAGVYRPVISCAADLFGLFFAERRVSMLFFGLDVIFIHRRVPPTGQRS